MTQYVYENQSGPRTTRNQPLSPKLLAVLNSVGKEAGVYFDVQSGGQSENHSASTYRKPGGWTGSHRHDDGNSADLKAFTLNGDGTRHYLSQSDPTDQKVWGRIVSLSRAAGATGIGAGEHYMGDQTAHIGFGKPAVWGDGNSSAGAPQWLKTAYEEGSHLPPLNIPQVASAPGVAPIPQVRPASLSIPSRTPSALDATQMFANGSKPTSDQISAFYPGAPQVPPQSVRAISVNPDGTSASAGLAGMPSAAMYGNTRAPGSPVTHAPSYSEFSNDNGQPIDTRTAALSIPQVPRPPIYGAAPSVAPMPPKVSVSDGFGQQTDFNKANQQALQIAALNAVPGLGAAVSGISGLGDLLTNPAYGQPPKVVGGFNTQPAMPQRIAAQAPAMTAAQRAALAYVPPSPFAGDYRNPFAGAGVGGNAFARPPVVPMPMPGFRAPVIHPQAANNVMVRGGLVAPMPQQRPAALSMYAQAPIPSVPQPISQQGWNDARYQQAQSDLRNAGMIDQFGMVGGGNHDAAH